MSFRFGKQAEAQPAPRPPKRQVRTSQSTSTVREFRSLRARELRAETAKDGKRYLSGYAALYNNLSEDLGWGMRERIIPGAFTRALKEKQDVRHLINHDPNLVLGRTKAGTTELSEDSKGLKFRTLMPDCGYANDLFESVSRGDIDECSFGFMAVRTAWIEEPDPDDEKVQRTIRELHDVDLFDVSTVTYPAYPGTSTMVERSLFPDGVPAEIRSRIQHRDDKGDTCGCDCPECQDDDCENCSMEDCDDAVCRANGCPMQDDDRSLREKDKKKTKRVDGEDLTADCFLIVGDPEDTSTWKLPWKFSTEEKTKTHLQNALARFNQLKNVSQEDKDKAWKKLVQLCKEHDIEVSEESSLRSRLTPDQLYDLEKDLILARAKVRLIQASL